MGVGESRVSVVVPACGRPGYLAECLESIKAQSRPPDEIIVSQDGEDAAVAAVAVAAGVRHVTNHPPLGQLGNRNRALRLAQGDFVAMVDDDDRWEPAFLETMLRVLDANPDCGFCSADHWLIDSAGRVLHDQTRVTSERFGRSELREGVHADVFEQELRMQPFPLQFSLFRRPVLEAVGFIPSYAGTAPDFGLMLALGLSGASCYYVAERLGAYRIHAGQHTALGRIEMTTGRVACLRDAAARCPPELRTRVVAAYREATVEQAVAFAHAGRRREALLAFRGGFALGFGSVRMSRVAVLVALLLGVERSPSALSG